MRLSVADCDILITVNRRMAALCLAGGVALLGCAAAAMAAALVLNSGELLKFGCAVAGSTALVPFKTWYDRVTSITLLRQVKDLLSRGGTLSTTMQNYLQNALAR